MEDYSHLVGDSRVDNLIHDFNSNVTILNMTRYRPGREEIEVRFEGVVNQDFQIIARDNIIFGIEETDWDTLKIHFPELMKLYKNYKKISPADQARLASGIIKCFHIRGSTGLEGYVIAETIRIIK